MSHLFWTLIFYVPYLFHTKNLNLYFHLSIVTMNSMVLGNYTRSKLPEVDLIRMHYVSPKKIMFLLSLILRQGNTLVVWFLSVCLCVDYLREKKSRYVLSNFIKHIFSWIIFRSVSKVSSYKGTDLFIFLSIKNSINIKPFQESFDFFLLLFWETWGSDIAGSIIK